jgi:dephospho-CoA kinase
VISSDDIVHRLLRENDEVKGALLGRLGEGILGEDGEIDRKKVGEIVFGDRESLAWLEGLLHPLVSAVYFRWREELAELPDPPAVCVTEVPLLYEVGAEARFDKIVVITAPRLLREQRTNVPMAGRSERLIDDREKVKRADYSYVNTGGLEDLDAWVAGVMEELRIAGGRPA